ncbi:TIGR02281 family clan AA aspartic protease [Aquabacterium soli]|uniref:TIGR02281 family clan AA aspartic protease n=1 Tax=Aquabacterium soli TaxID=2493092 RepID=A0A3R8S9C5_9BURK|nr:retropepsin-like aspartic protease [Aquabacterium soli]RRS05316.1 TIGR02281 family clan AA aspartic protease [Aquabacterium soli]
MPWFVVSLLALGMASAQAQSVAMTGGMGSRALLVINGGQPKALAAGDTHLGVKVLSVTSEQAVVDIGGKRQTVRLGEGPVSVGGSGGGGGGGSQIVLAAGRGGHFFTLGSINGRSVNFVVDTGATLVAMSAAEAQRIGLKYEHGQPGYSSTANGVIRAYRIKLNSVRIGDVELQNVEASVSEGSMPYVLLGNSFLSRFQMKRENDTMTLVKRY